MTPEEIYRLAKYVAEHNIGSFQDGDYTLLVFAQEIVRLHDEADRLISAPTWMDKLKRFLALANRVFQIAESNASAETKYDLIFSEDLGPRALSRDFSFEYYDPDTSYEEDIAAYVSALREKCAELRQIGADR